jgi:large subunit ribosomal protein L29
MEFKDVKDLSETELTKKAKSARADLFTLKMKNSLGQLANPLEIRDARRAVARVKTAMAQKARGNK